MEDLMRANRRCTHLPALMTFQIMDLLELLRRSGTLAHKREFGLSGVEWRIMSVVGAHAPLSLNDLSELLGLDTGQVSRAAKILVERGLLDRSRNPGGPSITITPTSEGAKVYNGMVDLAVRRNAKLVEGIPDEDLKRVAQVLESVRAHALALLDDERSQGN